MRNRYITEECNKILNFWKLEEYFTPSDYPFERCVEYDEYKTTRFTLCGFVGFEMRVEYDRH